LGRFLIRRYCLRCALPAGIAATIALLIAASPALAATATLQQPDSPNAHAIDDIYRAVLGVTVTIFVLVGGWLVYSAVRFRERKGEPAYEPPQFHGSFRLEVGWTIVPILILAALCAYTFAKLPDVIGTSSNAMVVKVQGVQFAWNFTYANGKSPSGSSTLVLPVDTPVKLLVTSGDVNHDFWVPDLSPKIDAIPGQTNTLEFKPTAVGTFHGQCAEFCGLGHATMLITVRVLPKDQFRTYMSKLKA
jgi:cytochrome c oxidase subunit 2